MPWTKVYGNREDFEKVPNWRELRGITYREALHEASAQMLESDPDVFLIGEGIDDPGGVFGTTKDLHKRFGVDRVMDSPLAENGITGVAIGAAMAGMRPILVHMRVDFMPMSMDQIVNHAAKWNYMFGGAVNVPIVIRSIIGRGWGSAAQHSQSLQASFAHYPGLKVAMPATPYDAKGLLRSAVYDGNPVIFIEHRWLFEHVGHVPEEPYTVPIGEGIVRREGTDVTIVAISLMVFESMKAAAELEKEGVSAEVIDLRTLKPMDAGIVMNSVKKTGRLVVADTGWTEYGAAAEIVTKVTEDPEAFRALKAPAARVALPDVPTPASHVLEQAFYKGAPDIAAAARKVMEASR